MFKKVITPRISDTNRGGHVGHNAIPVWFEHGFLEIIKIFNPELTTPSLILVNLNVDFINQIGLGKDVEVTTGIKKLGNSSFVLLQKIYQEEQLCASGLATFVHMNYSTNKSVNIPQAIRLKLEEHLIPDNDPAVSE